MAAEPESPVTIEALADEPDLTHHVVRPWRGPARLARADGAPAIDLGYELDEYQVRAAQALDQSENVVVSAPTSSGKTSVALWALARCLQQEDGARAVFCAPIKALSNQMFSEFHARFPGQVGLMTGDHIVAPDSPILVATTEIFRCMLRTNLDFARNLRTAIFDEVHYLSDTERGPAWEESIILLSPGVTIVCLSATMANPLIIAGWLCQLKCRPAHAVVKRQRAVPLRHHIHPVGDEPSSLLRVMDPVNGVDKWNIEKAARKVEEWHAKGKGTTSDAERKKDELFVKHITAVLDFGWSPMLVFCFAKQDCDALAASLLGSPAFRDTPNGTDIRRVIGQAESEIDDAWRACQQVEWVTKELLPHGIGVHHGGVVPFAREVTEKLFKEGLLRVLICTETFGMGLNMPAKVVVFRFSPNQPLGKFDGTKRRLLTPLEYQQMSGRAGRRGKDDSGIVVLALSDRFEATDVLQVLDRPSPPVSSQYELHPCSVLNMLKHCPGYPEWFIRQTLMQFELKGSQDTDLLTSLSRMLALLKDPRVGLVDRRGHLTELGRACISVDIGDTMLVGRLLGEGALEDEDPLDILAYVTTLILQQPKDRDSDGMDIRCSRLRGLAAKVEEHGYQIDAAVRQANYRRKIDEQDTLEERLHKRTYLMDAFRSTWLAGSSFDELVEAARRVDKSLDAGNLVRVVRRVDECARQIAAAARDFNLGHLASRLEKAMAGLRRGVPFAESLYFPREVHPPTEPGSADDPLRLPQRTGDAHQDPWFSEHAPGDEILLDPRKVGFSHNTIAARFQDGSSLKAKVRRLLSGEEDAEALARSIRIVFYQGHPYTLGNRRLAVLRMYSWWKPGGADESSDNGLLLPFQVASESEAMEWDWNKKFTTGGILGVRTVIRSTGEVIGIGQADSHVSLDDAFDEEAWEQELAEDGSFWAQYARLSPEVPPDDSPAQAPPAPAPAPAPARPPGSWGLPAANGTAPTAPAGSKAPPALAPRPPAAAEASQPSPPPPAGSSAPSGATTPPKARQPPFRTAARAAAGSSAPAPATTPPKAKGKPKAAPQAMTPPPLRQDQDPAAKGRPQETAPPPPLMRLDLEEEFPALTAAPGKKRR